MVHYSRSRQLRHVCRRSPHSNTPSCSADLRKYSLKTRVSNRVWQQRQSIEEGKELTLIEAVLCTSLYSHSGCEWYRWVRHGARTAVHIATNVNYNIIKNVHLVISCMTSPALEPQTSLDRKHGHNSQLLHNFYLPMESISFKVLISHWSVSRHVRVLT